MSSICSSPLWGEALSLTTPRALNGSDELAGARCAGSSLRHSSLLCALDGNKPNGQRDERRGNKGEGEVKAI